MRPDKALKPSAIVARKLFPPWPSFWSSGRLRISLRHFMTIASATIVAACVIVCGGCLSARDRQGIQAMAGLFTNCLYSLDIAIQVAKGKEELTYATTAFQRKSERWPRDYAELQDFVQHSNGYLVLGEFRSVDFTNLPADRMEICFIPTGLTNQERLIFSLDKSSQPVGDWGLGYELRADSQGGGRTNFSPPTNSIADSIANFFIAVHIMSGGEDLTCATRAFRRKSDRWPMDYAGLQDFVRQSNGYLVLGEYQSIDLTNLPGDCLEICFVPKGQTNQVWLTFGSNRPQQPTGNGWGGLPAGLFVVPWTGMRCR